MRVRDPRRREAAALPDGGLDVGLGLENTIARARALIAVGIAATNLVRVTELEDRLAALEAVHAQPDHDAPAFPAESGP